MQMHRTLFIFSRFVAADLHTKSAIHGDSYQPHGGAVDCDEPNSPIIPPARRLPRQRPIRPKKKKTAHFRTEAVSQKNGSNPIDGADDPISKPANRDAPSALRIRTATTRRTKVLQRVATKLSTLVSFVALLFRYADKFSQTI